MDKYKIIKIFDKKTGNLVENYIIKLIQSKYSSTKQPIFKLIVDDNIISRNNNLCVEYTCNNCGNNNIITLNIFMRKINKISYSKCDFCKNNDLEKCLKQSEFVKNNFSKIINGIKQDIVKKTVLETKIYSENKWHLESDIFKSNYFKIYLTLEEFNNIKSKILSINNQIIKKNDIDFDNWQYAPIYLCNNQQKYHPVLINIENNTIVKLYYIEFSCEICDNIFTSKKIETQKNKDKIICKMCGLSNLKFKTKSLKIDDIKICYHSNYELRFIKWCIDNKIKIKNGPVVNYCLNGLCHKYCIDFEFPDKKIIAEFKDNHQWHIKQKETGKFNKKIEAAEKWSHENNYQFKVIFPNNLSSFKQFLISI